ncbi:bacteriohemerythrin [Alysiella filiformis]|uniref:Hemerythrin-like metal-binding domain protein n=1 Tax=Alysiella filiformis DSM 16848 TaxID=1120981 RepID=A0A286EFG7_9NEIS|nr:bacteriohemerythrin [Alysiella filiformis]QMT31773.1 bacteriohemerythrin [Alysiella filiformis]UBQ55213.1 bacteriohemerythrin [Alysiella filiformis DSM 16848]SOD69574.1 hemerythrin-like metal-binding domain protein [Alysiella filiformis DSM 16848]
MAHIFWTADLDTGFHDIDEQHKQLVHHINELHAAHEAQNAEQMNISLFDLISCTMNHFAYEEEMLAESGYHLLEAHKRVHQNFVDKLVEYQMKMMENPNVAEELLNILDGWLFRHIRINDHGYINMVTQAGTYQKDANGNLVRTSGADAALFSNVAFDGWETQSLNPEPTTVETPPPTSPQPTAWERLVAQHEQKLAQEQNQNQDDDDDDDKPRGWAATF